MGSYDNERDRYDNEGPVHSVTITQPFYLGVVPVTQRQWSAVMGNNPSSFVDENRPVEGVNWQEAQEFCAEVSRRLGRRCRLPYEAEWEYACRAGTLQVLTQSGSLLHPQTRGGPASRPASAGGGAPLQVLTQPGSLWRGRPASAGGGRFLQVLTQPGSLRRAAPRQRAEVSW
jgi:ligand-binding SRPBCC domain-containing protein